MSKINGLDELQDISAESGVVCSVINNPELYVSAEFLQASHFSQKELGAIYYVCGELIKNGVTKLDAFNITIQSNSNKGIAKLISEYGGDKFIKEITDNASIVARGTVEEYLNVAKKVSELGFRRELLKKLRSYEGAVLNTSKSLGELNNGIITDLDGLAEKYIAGEAQPMYRDKIDSILEGIEEKRKRSESGQYGLPWFLDIFNDSFGSLQYSELYVLAGRFKSLKSVMLLNQALFLAQKGYSVFFSSTELDDEKDTLRSLAILSGQSIDLIRAGAFNDIDYQKYKDAVHLLKNMNFQRMYNTGWTKDNLLAQAKIAKHNFGSMDAIIHDYVKVVGVAESSAKSNLLGDWTNFLKNDVAGHFGCPVVTAVQLNRLNDIADSDSIARYASFCAKVGKKSREQIVEHGGVECGNYMAELMFARDGSSIGEGDWIDLYSDSGTTTNLRVYEAKKQHEEIAPDFI